MKLFFITTDHLETRIWFRDDEDFRVGMNCMAAAAAKLGVSVLAFILMSNHVHFLLLCTKEEAKRFIDLYKKLYGTHFCNRYGENRFLRRNNVDIQEITLEDEGFEKVVAYIIMNSVAARITLNASGYRWGSGSCYFNDNKERGTALSEYSGREQSRILKSNVKLPQHWRIGAGRYILPDSYVRTDIVEKIYKTPKRMFYFLNNSSKAKKALSREGFSFRDQVLLEALKDMPLAFGKNNLGNLTDDEYSEVFKQLRWRFGADIYQISRVTGFTYSKVTEMIESF